MSEKAAVIIPIYKTELNGYELIALKQCYQILHGQTIIIAKPTSLSLTEKIIAVVGDQIEEFDDDFFKDIQGYNKLMLSSFFYERFLNYEYILIYQLDCFVFKDELDYWCNQQWDYIGAPWIRKTYHKNTLELLFAKIGDFLTYKFTTVDKSKPHKQLLKNQVGNGGFSLRKVRKFFDLTIELRDQIEIYLDNPSDLYNEDVFWSIEVNRKEHLLNIPNAETAIRFAYEVPPLKSKNFRSDNAPFGCHDWDHYKDFWKPIFKIHGYDI